MASLPFLIDRLLTPTDTELSHQVFPYPFSGYNNLRRETINASRVSRKCIRNIRPVSVHESHKDTESRRDLVDQGGVSKSPGKKKPGRHGRFRTADLYRVKVLKPTDFA